MRECKFKQPDVITHLSNSQTQDHWEHQIWQGYRAKGTFIHCWCVCKIKQSLWKTVWLFLRKLTTLLPLLFFSHSVVSQVFVTPRTEACQASLFFIISQSLLKLMSMSIDSWCHPTISSSVVPFSSCPQSFPVSGSFPMSWLFSSGGQSIGDSASASVLPMNIQLFSFRTDWFDLAVQETLKRLQHHSSKASILWCSAFFHIHTWLLEKP